MNRLGISVYPEHSTIKKDFEYMELAAQYGFSRLFTCFLSVKNIQESIELFTKYIEKAHSLGFIVSLDTNSEVFTKIGASYSNIKIFADMKVDILRLDVNFGTFMDTILMKNPYGIKIELNGSFDNGAISLLENGITNNNLSICHNFYPQKYTGLNYDHFINITKKWKNARLHTCAFISSQTKNTFGPWEVYQGLPTLEIHRNLPIDVQARHLISTGLIDDMIIGNAYASKKELESLTHICFESKQIKIVFDHELDETEKRIIYKTQHFSRLDPSDYVIRSYLTKKYAKNIHIPVKKTNQSVFHKGDVIMINDQLEKYRGELQIVLQDIPNEGYQNKIGHIEKNEFIILDNIHPGDTFSFF